MVRERKSPIGDWGRHGMTDDIRSRLRQAIKAKRLSMARVSSHAGLGDTYLFDALVGRKGDGAARLHGSIENFELIAQMIGLDRDWLRTGEGPMWSEERPKRRFGAKSSRSVEAGAGRTKDDPDDLIVVIEEALQLLLGLPAEKAKACARSLAAVARNPPQTATTVDRCDAIRISVRAILRTAQDDAS